VPLAMEPIATLFEWPEPELDEGDFLTELLDRTGALLLLDVANVWANARNAGTDPVALLDRLPLDRLAYVHVAGGAERDGLYHDTHTHPVPPGVIELVGHLADRVRIPGVMLERDGEFPPVADLEAELDAVAAAGRPGGEVPSVHAVQAQEPVARLHRTRERLAAQQSGMVAALLARTAPPPAALAVKRTEATRST
jgi:uncharacterized protein (UPF0276 family)